MMRGCSLAVICWLSLTAAAQIVGDLKVSYLDAGSIVDFRQPLNRGFFESNLRTYCYRGSTKTIGRFFESVELQLEIDSDDYIQYEGGTLAEVLEHYEQKRSMFSLSLFEQKRPRLRLSPFEQQCIGIETTLPYRVRLQLVRVDFWRVIQLTVAVALFTYASQLSHNSLFYYITGVLLGICSSFMLLIWLSSKLVPRRPLMYGVLIGGWTIGIYVLQLLWENLQVIVLTYRTYVFWYILVTGVVSFFFCYRMGPPRNKRSKNIVKWLLQLIALLLIYLSSQFEEATAAIILLTIVIHYFPRSFIFRTRAWYLHRFPPKRRLLTSEEFFEQGVRETTKALDELRSYASSPECKQWKVMSKLRDPLRFGAFVEGASHLRDEEILHSESANYGNEDDLTESELSFDEDGSDEEHGAWRPGQQNGGPYLLQRSQRSVPMESRRRRATRDDISEDEDDDEDREAQVIHLTRHVTPNRRATPTRLATPSSASRLGSPKTTAATSRASVTRSARLVTAAQRQSLHGSSSSNGVPQGRRNLAIHREFNDDEEEQHWDHE